MGQEDNNMLPSLETLKDENYLNEGNSEKYAEVLAAAPQNTGFEIFQAHRKAAFGDFLPHTKTAALGEDERKGFQYIIEKIKSLGFFNAGYIDNLIIYFEVLKNPILDEEYLTTIIDKYIKPDVRAQGIRPFQKFAIGYFCNEISRGGGSIRATSKMMGEVFVISPSEIENANRSYKEVAAFLEKDKEANFIADFLAIMILYFEDFSIEKYIKTFVPHHNAQTAKEKFMRAYEVFAKRIDDAYIPFIRDNHQPFPYFLDEILLPELKDYIATFSPKTQRTHDVNMLAGIVMAYTLLNIAPKLLNDKEKLGRMGWVEE